MIHFVLFATAVFNPPGSWQFATEHDPLGQPVYVAVIAPELERPYVALKYLCGGVEGVALQFNLGTMAKDFSTKEPKFEDVRFEFPEGKYESAAQRAPLTDGIDTFEIKGSEAAFIAGLMTDSEQVTISRAASSLTFSLAGAKYAIDEVKSACPFKYKDS